MIRYWFEFDFSGYEPVTTSLGVGCGITAYNYDDALYIICNKIFKGRPLPAFKTVIEDVDVSTLDVGHVLPNMSSPNMRGVWFPLGITA